MLQFQLALDYLTAHTKAARALNATTSYLVSAGLDAKLNTFQIAQPHQLNLLTTACPIANVPIYSLAVLAQSSPRPLLLSGLQNGTICTTDLLKGGAILRQFQAHSQSVNCLVINAAQDTLLSGSWDGTCKLWNLESGQLIQTFNKHLSYAVTACFTLSPQNAQTGRDSTTRILAGSQSKALVLFSTSNGNEPLDVYSNAHQDIIRSVNPIGSPEPDSPPLYLTCSNDGDVAFWTITNDNKIVKVPVLNGNAAQAWTATETQSFLFDAKGFINSDQQVLIAVAADDPSCRVAVFQYTKQGLSLTCTDSLWPFISTVWSVDFINSPHDKGTQWPDIATASGDGAIRIFTSRPEAAMPEMDRLRRRDEALKVRADTQKASAASIEPSKLPKARDRANHRGKAAGHVALFVADDGVTIEAYQWTGSEWQKVGDMIDSSGQQEGLTMESQMYAGDAFFPAGRYDHVFDVEIETKPGRKYQLPYRCTDNPMEVAEKFCAREQIARLNVPDICSFIKANARGSGTTAATRPLEAPSSPAVLTSPKVATTLTSDEGSSSQMQYFNLANALPVLFNAAGAGSWRKAMEKMLEIAKANESPFDIQDQLTIESLVVSLEKPNFHKIDLKTREIQFLYKPEKWDKFKPTESLFPFFDMWRMCATHSASADFFRRGTQGSESVQRALGVMEEVGGLFPSSPISLCILRYLANECTWSSTRPFFVEQLNWLIGKLESMLAGSVAKLGAPELTTTTERLTCRALFGLTFNLAIALNASGRMLKQSVAQTQRDALEGRVATLLKFLEGLMEEKKLRSDIEALKTGMTAVAVCLLTLENYYQREGILVERASLFLSSIDLLLASMENNVPKQTPPPLLEEALRLITNHCAAAHS